VLQVLLYNTRAGIAIFGVRGEEKDAISGIRSTLCLKVMKVQVAEFLRIGVLASVLAAALHVILAQFQEFLDNLFEGHRPFSLLHLAYVLTVVTPGAADSLRHYFALSVPVLSFFVKRDAYGDDVVSGHYMST
jgi:hypothetical protein